MNCLECQELLQRRLDGEPVAGTEPLEQHLSQCAACREQHACAVRLLEGLAHLPKMTLAPSFAQTLTAKVLLDRRQRQDRTRRRVLVTMALAASVLVMLFAAYNWIPQTVPNDPGPKGLIAIQPEVNPLPKKAPQQKPPMKDDSRDTFAALRDHAKVVLAAANLDNVDRLPAVDALPPMLDPGMREAGQEVSDGVRTVTRNARKAFDFFARELPMPDLGDEKN